MAAVAVGSNIFQLLTNDALIQVPVFWIVTPCSNNISYAHMASILRVKQHGPPKCWYPVTSLHVDATQKIWIFIPLPTSNLASIAGLLVLDACHMIKYSAVLVVDFLETTVLYVYIKKWPSFIPMLFKSCKAEMIIFLMISNVKFAGVCTNEMLNFPNKRWNFLSSVNFSCSQFKLSREECNTKSDVFNDVHLLSENIRGFWTMWNWAKRHGFTRMERWTIFCFSTFDLFRPREIIFSWVHSG
jgi:hypothetical protein